MKSNKITIIVSPHEPDLVKGYISFNAIEFEMNVIYKELPSGDIACMDSKSLVGNIGIERKDKDDFVSSVKDGRVFRQAYDLHNNYDISIIAISGSLEDVRSNIRKNALYSALSSLATKYRCSVMMFPNDEMLVYSVLKMFQHATYEIDLNNIVKFDISQESREIASLCCIKDIGKKAARNILEEYTIREVTMIDDVKELMKIKNVGKVKAKNIIDFFSDGRRVQDYNVKIRELHSIIDKKNIEIEKLKKVEIKK